ncbi:hypothetical protein R6Q59_029408 [Mikania micrantha]
MSSCSVENQNPNHPSPLNLTKLWLKNDLALNHVVPATIRHRSFSNNHPPIPETTPTIKTLGFNFPKTVASNDLTSLLSDEILLHILSKISGISQRNPNCLVSKRWLNLQGRMVSDSGTTNFGVFVNHETGLFRIGADEFLCDDRILLPVDEVDFGLKVLASVYPNLRKLVVMNCSEIGLMSVAEECPSMQELVLNHCNDNVLIAIAAFPDLQLLKLIGDFDGFYRSLISDRGLTFLAQGCKRLVKLELQGCEGGYEGIKAIGESCQMLEELKFFDHRMDNGWLSALSYCESLKTLKFVSCKGIDLNHELDEHLGFCPVLERLHLERCQLRDKQTVRALFLVCQTVEEVAFKNCWGLNDAMFFNATLCRGMKFVSIERCSRLTTQGLEAVVISWKKLESLKLISCKNIKDDDVTPMLSVLLSDLKDFKWCPGNTSFLSTRLSSSDMGKRGAKFFKKFQI